MRAAVYRGDGKLVAEEWPRPAIGDGEVLLRLLGCGLCGSDIAKVMDPTTPAPLVLGHEVVGEVVRLGAGVTSCGIGDVSSPPITCRAGSATTAGAGAPRCVPRSRRRTSIPGASRSACVCPRRTSVTPCSGC